MTTLQIEHRISDYPTWRAAFDRFAPARVDAGVREHRVRRPVGDECCVIIDLEFDDSGSAERFLGFLEEVVWATRANSPALDGSPRTRILESCD